MAIRTQEELMTQIRARIGDDNSDEALGLLEDISDTFGDLSKKATPDGEDWKQKYQDLDKEWRDKYKARFFEGSNEPPQPQSNPASDDSAATEIQIADLFT